MQNTVWCADPCWPLLTMRPTECANSTRRGSTLVIYYVRGEVSERAGGNRTRFDASPLPYPAPDVAMRGASQPRTVCKHMSRELQQLLAALHTG